MFLDLITVGNKNKLFLHTGELPRKTVSVDTGQHPCKLDFLKEHIDEVNSHIKQTPCKQTGHFGPWGDICIDSNACTILLP